MKNRNIVIILISVLIVVLTISLIIYCKNEDSKYKEMSKKEYSEKNIQKPDRIIYKSSNDDEYYEILPNEELYDEVITKLSENIGKIDQNTQISQSVIDIIEKEGSYIEFDYNTISKNYIIPFKTNDNISKGIIKLKSDGGTLLNSKIKNVQSIKKMIDKYIKKENKKSYKMTTNKEYTSNNTLETFPYRYAQKFKEVDYMVHQVIITNWEDYELYSAMCNLNFSEPLPENIFDNNNLILTVSIPHKVNVKISIGNLKYTYDNDEENSIYGYNAHLLVVSKIVNSNCIYNINNVIEKNNEKLEEFKEEYDEKVENLDKDIFVTDFEEYISSTSTKQLVSISKAEKIADIAFKEAERIAGSYDKSTQTMKKENVVANNFFTFKSDEPSKNYGTKRQAYVFQREDEMRNGISIYIDINTGKVIGGKAFGD